MAKGFFLKCQLPQLTMLELGTLHQLIQLYQILFCLPQWRKIISLAANSFNVLPYRKRWPKHLYIRWRLVIDSPKTITSMAKTSSPCLLVATHSYLPPSFLLRIWSNRESFASGVSCLFSFRHTILKGMSPSGAQLRWTASPVTNVKFVYSWSMTTERGTKEKFKCVG